MRIGIPKEIKNNESRVGMTPAGVAELVRHGHEVFVQHTAGEGSGFSDEAYIKAGATILPTIEETYEIADMIVKVKEPIEPEYKLVKPGQVLFTYFHFACDKPLTDAMINAGHVRFTMSPDNPLLNACVIKCAFPLIYPAMTMRNSVPIVINITLKSNIKSRFNK